MARFSPDRVEYGDDIGLGLWLNGHYLEHQQFVGRGMVSSPVRFISDYDLIAWAPDSRGFQKQWLNVHQQVHQQLRDWTGVQGFNLADVELDDEVSFGLWMDAHAEEHLLIRRTLGIT